jgi:hypothetical protein
MPGRWRIFREEIGMHVSKSFGVVLLAGIVAILAGGRTDAQKPENSSAEAPLPKDIYPDSRNRLPLPNAEYQSGRLAVGIYQPGVSNWDPQLIKASRGANLKYSMDVSDPLLEIAVLVAARELDVQYEWTQWETHGRDPKDPRYLDPAIIDIIKYEKPWWVSARRKPPLSTSGAKFLARGGFPGDFRPGTAFIRPQEHRGFGLGDGRLFRSRS